MEDNAYLAGILDGEGCIGVRINDKGYVIQTIEVCMTTPEVLYYLHSTYKVGSVYKKKGTQRDNRKQVYTWTISDILGVNLILQAVLPYLRVKKEQAILSLMCSKLRGIKYKGLIVHRDIIEEIARLCRRSKDLLLTYQEVLDLAQYLRQRLHEERGC